jgi:hypothetical protein
MQGTYSGKQAEIAVLRAAKQARRGVQYARIAWRFKETPKRIFLNNKPNFHFAELYLKMWIFVRTRAYICRL